MEDESPFAQLSSSQGSAAEVITDCDMGLGVELCPLTRASKSISASPVGARLKLDPLEAPLAKEAVCCSIRRTSRRCCECSCSTRDPRDLITLQLHVSGVGCLAFRTHVINRPNCSAFRTVKTCVSSHEFLHVDQAHVDPWTWPRVEAGPKSR